jgi:CMP-N-acetylneuraminic acid synthetase
MSEKIAFFLPTRKGSERVKNKNTRPFADIEGGLVENKIKQKIEICIKTGLTAILFLFIIHA